MAGLRTLCELALVLCATVVLLVLAVLKLGAEGGE